ncbi:FkbM family methyltransferase [Candidatus Shapirobacteria bacterium]|nr:FkbM family methyltransferase [Candidatus Shapirobacteria bacterium]
MLKSTRNFLTALFEKKIILHNGLILSIRNYMDWYISVETIVLNNYQLKNKHKVIIDIGAAIGDFSVFASKFAEVVYAIEPEPSSVKLIQKNIKQNNIKNIMVFPIALNSVSSKTSLSVDPRNYAHTNTYSKTNIISVKSQSFSSFLLDNVKKYPVYIKCDCEGAEYDIFNTLSSKDYLKISEIVMEYHLFNDEHRIGLKILKTKLLSNGFKIRQELNPIHDKIGFLFAFKN